MIQLGLIGYPLGHSLSPKIHNAALDACGLAGVYSLYPIVPDDKKSLGDLLARVRSGELTGLNVTIPHKQNVIQFMDELTPSAQAIGAVNTIYMRDQKLVGDNTDAPGFLSDLKSTLIAKMQNHNGLNALVLGAGGSARAVVHALVNDGWKVAITSRRFEKATGLADQFENTNAVENYSQSLLDSNLQLIVNTTPVGMKPNIEDSPLPENLSLPQHAAIYDLVYNPRETKLVKDATAKGLNATTGLGMLIEQAALAFECWTGQSPNRKMLWNAVEN